MKIVHKIASKKISIIILISLIIVIALARIYLVPSVNKIIKIGDKWESTASRQVVTKVDNIQKINFSHEPNVLQQQFQAYLKSNNLNAVAVTTATGSKKPLVIANGNLSSFSKDKLDENSEFQIGSIQKIFTGIIIQKLVEEGKINLKTPLNKYYPNIPYGDKLTVWNLLTHTTGILDGSTKKIRAVSGEQNQVNYVLQHMTSTPPHYVYASANFSLLAGIIMQVTHESYRQNVIDNIFKPLGMNDTYFYQDLPIGAKLAYPPYVKTRVQQAYYTYDIRKQMSLLIGAGQIYSTPADYFKFVDALMDGKLIPKSDFATFLPRQNHDYYNGLYNFYGVYEAGGSQSGYNLCFVFNPKTHSQTVLFSSNYMIVPNKTLACQFFVIANRTSDIIHWIPQF